METGVDPYLVDARQTVPVLLCRKVCRFGGPKCEKQGDFAGDRIPIGSLMFSRELHCIIQHPQF
jgi:hypothetical protein